MASEARMKVTANQARKRFNAVGEITSRPVQVMPTLH